MISLINVDSPVDKHMKVNGFTGFRPPNDGLDDWEGMCRDQVLGGNLNPFPSHVSSSIGSVTPQRSLM